MLQGRKGKFSLHFLYKEHSVEIFKGEKTSLSLMHVLPTSLQKEAHLGSDLSITYESILNKYVALYLKQCFKN